VTETLSGETSVHLAGNGSLVVSPDGEVRALEDGEDAPVVVGVAAGSR
jgi:hypothetical protein